MSATIRAGYCRGGGRWRSSGMIADSGPRRGQAINGELDIVFAGRRVDCAQAQQVPVLPHGGRGESGIGSRLAACYMLPQAAVGESGEFYARCVLLFQVLRVAWSALPCF